MKIKMVECSECDGTGKVPGSEVGLELRTLREKAEIRASDLADYMSISASYLYDLERGNRQLSNGMVASYQAGLEALGR